MNSILTGSRVYGTPRKDSDLDLVVLMEPKEAADLAMFHGISLERDESHYPSAQFHAGKINIIIETSKDAFEVWVKGTHDLMERLPVDRDTAVAHFDVLRAALRAKREAAKAAKEAATKEPGLKGQVGQ